MDTPAERAASSSRPSRADVHCGEPMGNLRWKCLSQLYQVRKRVFCVILYSSFYQDRLGTNIGKTQKETRFLIWPCSSTTTTASTAATAASCFIELSIAPSVWKQVWTGPCLGGSANASFDALIQTYQMPSQGVYNYTLRFRSEAEGEGEAGSGSAMQVSYLIKLSTQSPDKTINSVSG